MNIVVFYGKHQRSYAFCFVFFTVYTCHGSWTENSTVFIIARHAGSQHGVCISYRPLEGNLVRLVVGDACYRGLQPPPDHHLSANLTVHGELLKIYVFIL